MNFRSRQWCRRAEHRRDRNCPTPRRFDIAPSLSAAELIYYFTVLVCVYDTIHIIANTGMIFVNKNCLSGLKVHLHEIFLFWFFALIKHICIGQIIGLLNFFDFVLEFADFFEFFNIRRWLSWCRVSFFVNWVNAKWDSTSTQSAEDESSQNRHS